MREKFKLVSDIERLQITNRIHNLLSHGKTKIEDPIDRMILMNITIKYEINLLMAEKAGILTDARRANLLTLKSEAVKNAFNMRHHGKIIRKESSSWKEI